eukprot:CFRG5462T1
MNSLTVCIRCKVATGSFKRGFQSTAAMQAGQKIRESRGQARSGNEYGPITDTPDWSYVDTNEPAPKTKAQRNRTLKANLGVNRIQDLLTEITSSKK